MTNPIVLLAFIGLAPQDTIPSSQRPDSIQQAEVRTDTLREVEVRADTVLQVVRIMEENKKKLVPPQIPTLGDILDKYLPGVNDVITHPFAFKERKRERKHKRDRRILENYDRVQTFKDLLDAAIKQQQLEDEAEKRKAEAQAKP